MNDVIKAIIERKSIRKFTSEKISKENLELIVKCAINAPTGMNSQSWRFTVVQNPAAIQKLASAVAAELGRGSSYNFFMPNAVIITSCAKNHSLRVEDCACAMQSIFLSAHSLGIGAVWINQVKDTCDSAPVREVLSGFNIPRDHGIYGMAALGYPAEDNPKNERNYDVVEWML